MNFNSQPDEPPQGDAEFRGVNARLRPALLPPGALSAGRNIRCTAGTMRTREGLAFKPWFNNPDNVGLLAPLNVGLTGPGGVPLMGPGGPVRNPAPLSNFQGWGVFSDSDDQRWIVFAANGKVYYTKPGNTARPIGLPSGVSIAGQSVEFVSCNNSLLMFRGEGAAPLQTFAVTSDFMAISPLDNDPLTRGQNPDDGTSLIPNAEWGVVLQQRLILPNHVLGPGILSASDYLNYTRYQPTLESFRCNAGTNGALLAAFPVPTPDDSPSSALLVFLDDPSIRIISGIAGDLSGLARTDITEDYTCVNRKAIWRVGREVWFVAPGRGVCSLKQTETNKWQGVDVPMSLDLQPLFSRINWSQGSKIRGVKVGNKSYIAAPLNGSLTNNVLFVYDHEMQSWAGYDDGIAAQELLGFNFMGVDRLVVLTTGGYMGLHEQGSRDATGPTSWQAIGTSGTTRGYAVRSSLGRQRVTAIHLQLRTWNPRYSITATLSGANQTVTVASAKTRSRTKYYRPHTKPRWDATNVNDDHGTRDREDYSVDLTSATHLTNMNLDLFQEVTETLRVPPSVRGQHISFTLGNDQGLVELCGVSLETVKVDRRKGTKV